MNDDLPEPASTSGMRPWKLIGLITVLTLTIVAALVFALARNSSTANFQRGDPIERPNGAPAGDVYLVGTSPSVSDSDRTAIVADLGGHAPQVRTDTIEHVGRFTSAFGETGALITDSSVDR